MKKIQILTICILIIFGTQLIGSFFTSGNTNTIWYNENKPSFTPPNIIFPIIWPILYFLIALSLYFSLIKSNKKQKKKISIIFGLNLLLNIIWSYLFFKLENPLLAFINIILILSTIIIMIITTYKIDKKAGFLLIPYLLWVCFATILNLFFII